MSGWVSAVIFTAVMSSGVVL